MADLDLKVTGPVATIVDAVSKIIVAFIENDTNRRTTMNDEAKATQDKIMAQIYFDWRQVLERLNIVGPATIITPK